MDETWLQFGLPPKADASPARQWEASRSLPQSVIQRSQSHNQEAADDDEAVADLTDEPAQPRAIVYLEPSFSLDRPVQGSKWMKDWRYTITVYLPFQIKCIK